MNKLFRVLFIGAYIPYAILLSYYITRLYLCYFLLSALYLASCYGTLTHKPYFEKGVLAWVRVHRVCTLLLLLSLCIRSLYRNQVMTFAAVVVMMLVALKVPRRYQKKCEHPAVYVTCSMVYFSQADVLAKACTIILCILILYEPQSKQVTDASFDFAIEKRIRQYHTFRLLQVYMLFLMEYSLTRMNIWALVIILLAAGAFNAYACMTLSPDIEVAVSEYYMKVSELPSMYPLPLDILSAVNECDIAKKVFKVHQI